MTSASAPSTPHLPSPPSIPMGGGAPGEGPLPHGGTPHGGESGPHEPHGPPQPHDGAPHPPGDGDGLPHQPGENSDVERRTTISGHGAYRPVDGLMSVPQDATITVYAEHGSTITDGLGNLIEGGGDTAGVYSHTFYPGEQIPNYTIYPPDGLNIVGAPQTVSIPTRISELIREGMGGVHLAVCTFDETCPTGLVYDVEGVLDESTNILHLMGTRLKMSRPRHRTTGGTRRSR